jgi:hypothetical protein
MMHRWNADRCRIQLADSRQTRLDGGEARNVELCRCCGRDGWVAIHHRDQPDVVIGLLKLTVYAKVVASEGPRSDDRNA